MSDANVDAAISTVGSAHIIIAATPTYRALYTGLLKSFFDLMPMAHLAEKLCVGVQTAAIEQHALALDYGLRPLFMSLDGVPLHGLFATDDEFVDGRPSAALCERAEGLAEQTCRLRSLALLHRRASDMIFRPTRERLSILCTGRKSST